VAAVLGAVATLAVLGVAGTFGSDSPTSTRAGLATAVSGFTDQPVSQLVGDTSASVVGVRVVADPSAAPTTSSGVVLGRTEVLTAASVVSGAVAVTISTGGRVLDAQLVGTDPDTDLAVLRVKGGELTPARLGSARELVVGEDIVAVGIAGGDHRWVSTGVVSALDRMTVTGAGRMLAGLVETNVRSNAAAAGGALVNTSGAVVGLLSGAAPGHALPIDWARDLAEELMTTGAVHHGWFGVAAVDADDHPGGGARVTAVAPGSPADAAGVVTGDVVTSVGDQRVTDMADLVAAVARRRPGDPVTVALWRGGEQLHKEASLGSGP
jgi:putative serine protease PepD